MPYTPSDRARSFVTHIATRANDTPRARAALRSGLGRAPEQCHHMHPHVAPWLDETPSHHQERAFYTIAALIAHAPETADHEHQDPPVNLGGSLAQASQQHTLAAATTENYLHLVVRQTPATLCRYLTTVVLPLRSASNPVPIDFARLLDDLHAWPRRQQRITKTWLQTYYLHTATDHISA